MFIFTAKKQMLGILVILIFAFVGNAQDDEYQEDFDVFWRTINYNYAYFDKKQTDWEKVREIYTPKVSEVKNRRQFIRFLEIVLRELYDNHTQLNTNLSDSSRLVPSGTDIWAEWQTDKVFVTNLRKGFGAEKKGLKVGMQIVEFNGLPIEKAMEPFVGKSLKNVDVKAKNWAVNTMLAGDHKTKRVIKTKTNTFAIDEPKMLLSNYSYLSKLDKNEAT